MDLSSINDVTVLKSLAYDTYLEQQRLQGNLRMIEQRISDLQQVAPDESPVSEERSLDVQPEKSSKRR